MRIIYIMDNELPIPKDFSCINTFDEIIEKDISQLDTTYTRPVLYWAKNEFEKIFKFLNINNKFNLNNIYVTFFKSDYFGTPLGFFNPEKNLISIELRQHNTGKDSSIQIACIHELTHSTTSDYSLVGLAITEGIAIYMEELYCKVNNIPFNEILMMDERYVFSKNLVTSILKNVYQNNLELFFYKIQKGNEELLIKDINDYLKEKNIKYSATELLRLSSILFYAKQKPNSPLQEYKINQEMEIIRKEVLNCFNSKNKDDNFIIYEYLNTIKYICSSYQVLNDEIDNSKTITKILDEKLGLAIVKYGSKILLDNQVVAEIIKNTLDMFDCSNVLEDIQYSYSKKISKM